MTNNTLQEKAILQQKGTLVGIGTDLLCKSFSVAIGTLSINLLQKYFICCNNL